jgi:hypothetical protein
MSTAPRIHTDGVGGILKVTYDATVDSKAVGTVELPVELPINAIVYGGMINVRVPPTSGGAATVSLGLNTAADLLASTAIASVTGKVALVPVFTAASSVVTTAKRKLVLTIGTAALTAGKMDIYLNYYEA